MGSILRAGRNFWCERPVDGVGLLVDGDDYYRAFHASAQKAQHYILLAGWQFDSDACLLRGPEAENASLPVTLKKFLDALCQRNENLQVYMLAWDFHAVFALEREWMQQLVFNWTTSERFRFRFDDSHVDKGAHHQKFVVIDGQLSFLGGLDLCDHRWDDRAHRDPNPLRVSRGAQHKPFHDVQAYVVGHEASTALATLFAARWHSAGGDPLQLPPTPPPAFDGYEPHGAVPLAASEVVFSRTDPHGAPTNDLSCRELADLHLDAIEAARHLIYIETQYFSSKEIGDALSARLRRDQDSPLEVVIVLNMEAETLKEQMAVGLAQAQVISGLRKAAESTRNRLGIYYTLPHTDGSGEPERATYIHSKVMVVDDRFLTVGSANLTNRSTCVDTELNLAVETEHANDALGRSIVRARQSLIAEHLGVPDLDESGGLVALLDERARTLEGRLRRHPSPTDNERVMLEVVDPQQLPFDPSAIEDHPDDRSIFVNGLSTLWARIMGKGAAPASGAD